MKSWLCVLLLSGIALAQIPQSKHIWIVTEENHSYEEVVGNSSMPYFNALARSYGLATQYYSVQHNSLSALMWLVAGQKVTDDGNPQGCFDVDNIVRRLIAQQSTWTAYEEDLPYPGFQGLSYDNYVRRHNPLIDFMDSCTDKEEVNSVPFTQLAKDIHDDSTPNYAYITPNLLDDAHNGTLQEADQWLSEHIPPILEGSAFQPGGDGLMFIVFDEGELDGSPDDRCAANIPTGCGGRIATLVIGPQVRPAFQSGVLYSHYNLLSTVCAAMEMQGCPGAGQLALPMSDFFNTVRIKTPFQNSSVASPVHIAADTNNDSNVFAMQIYVDGQLKYKANGNSLDTLLPISLGQHLVVAQSWDTAGGIHKRAINVTVQQEAVVVTTPQPNAVVASPVAIVASGGGLHKVDTMQVYVDNALQYQVNGSTVNTQLTMSPGRHYVVAQAWSSGNTVAKTGFNVTVAKPSVSIVSPQPNSHVYSPVPLLGTTTNPAQVYAVQAYIDNVLSYQYTGTGIQAAVAVPVGPHSIVLQSWDQNKGIYKTSENITVDPIVVTIAAPKKNSRDESPVLIQASVPQNAPVYLMQVYVDNKLQYETSGTTVNTSLPISTGQHYLVVQAWDDGGETWKSGVNFVVVR